jgi:hypothetical protein
MITAVAETSATPPSTAATAPKTRKVDVETLSDNEAAYLARVPVFEVRARSLMGSLPGGIFRMGHDLVIEAEQAKKLRAFRAGDLYAYRKEAEHDHSEAWERDRPVRETIARADARVAAEKATEKAAAEKRYSDRKAAEAKAAKGIATSSNIRLT